MTNRVKPLLFVAALLSSGCPTATVSDNNLDFSFSGRLDGRLSSAPSSDCPREGGLLDDTGASVSVHLCFQVEEFNGLPPCDLGEPEYFYVGLEYPVEACGGVARADSEDLDVRFRLSGSQGSATIDRLPFGSLALSSCGEGESGDLGGAEYQCDDGSTALGNVPSVSLSYRFPD